MKKARKIVSILLVAAMMFTTIGANAFVPSEWGGGSNALHADRLEKVNKSDYPLMYADSENPHTVTVTPSYDNASDMLNDMTNFSAAMSVVTGTAGDGRLGNFRTAPKYFDNGVIGWGAPFWENYGIRFVGLSDRLIGLSQIQTHFYTIDRCFKWSKLDYDETEFKAALTNASYSADDAAKYWNEYQQYVTLYKHFATKNADGKYNDYFTFTADADGKIIYVSGVALKGFEADGTWTKTTASASDYQYNYSGADNSGTDYFTKNPVTLPNVTETGYALQWAQYTDLFSACKLTGTWTADNELSIAWQAKSDGTVLKKPAENNTNNGTVAYEKTFAAGETVHVPVAGAIGGSGLGTAFIKWDDRKNSSAYIGDISYSVDGGSSVKLADFNKDTKTYQIEVAAFANSVEVKALPFAYSTIDNAEQNVTLSGSDDKVVFNVTSEDGSATDTYTVNVVRGALKALVLDETNVDADQPNYSVSGKFLVRNKYAAEGDVISYDYATMFQALNAPASRDEDAVRDAVANKKPVKWTINSEKLAAGTYDVYIKGTAFGNSGVDSFYPLFVDSADTVYTDNFAGGTGFLNFADANTYAKATDELKANYFKLHWQKALSNVVVPETGDVSVQLLNRETPYFDKIMLIPAGADINAYEKAADNLITATFLGLDNKPVATVTYPASMAGSAIPTTEKLETAFGTATDTAALTAPEVEGYATAWSTDVLPAEDSNITVVLKEIVPTALLSNLTYSVDGGEAQTVTGFTAADEGGLYTVEVPYTAKSVVVNPTKVSDERVSVTTDAKDLTLDMTKGYKKAIINVDCTGATNSSKNRFTVYFKPVVSAVTINDSTKDDRAALTLGTNVWYKNEAYTPYLSLYQDRGQWVTLNAGYEFQNAHLLTWQNARDKVLDAYKKSTYLNSEDGTYSKDYLYSFTAPADGTMLIAAKDSDSSAIEEYAKYGYYRAPSELCGMDYNTAINAAYDAVDDKPYSFRYGEQK